MSALLYDDGAASWPEAPFVAGDRVRCVASTADVFRGIECRGMTGTVDRAVYYETEYPGVATEPGWVITVVWDQLLPRMLAYHDPADLERA
jgi:hypothetical protein